MNTRQSPQTTRARVQRLAVLSSLLACSATASLFGQTATVSINASSTVRNVPAGLGGVVCGTPFWNTVTPDYRGDLVNARIGTVRITAYPADSSGGVGTLEALDTKVAQIINAGARPLFIQCIESNSNTTFKNALLRLDGTLYPAGDTTPINQRVATNIAYLVNRYKSAPFNLATQYWEIGNEPDLPNVNYAVATTQEYINFFSLAHNQLVSSGVRGNVLLAGPVLSYEYGFGNGSDGYKIRDDIMRDFLAACGSQVDIVTRHVYGLINVSWEGLTNTAYNQLNHDKEMAHFNHNIATTRGEYGLLALMGANGLSSSVGTGITEMNLFNDGTTIYNHTITQGLWFLLADHYTLYNPRSYLTNGFQFDRNNHDLAYYKNNLRSFPYWASYIHGRLTGDQILAAGSSDSHIVVTASKDASYLYVRVINRHNANTYTANITTTGAPSVTAATRYRLSATDTPDTGVATAFNSPSFTDTFAPMTATVYRFPRTDAPTPPTPPAAPTEVVLSTDFATAPSGMVIYANPQNLTSTPATNTANFQPVITTGGDLKLTTTTPYLATAVVFNNTAHKLASPKSRLQVRYGFKVNHPNADGFVFGAYSANPGAQGQYGQALGYHGQNNRLWGVKVDNNPDQLGVISGTTDPVVEGWASQTIQPYSTQELYMLIDYDGAAGTVRARLYQGTSEAGTLRADVTNRVGVPATLPAGTTFGFTGGTSNYSQETLIHDLTVLTDGDSWSNQDVGAVATAGSTTITGGTYTVKGSGQYIWNGLDEFQFAYQQLTGNCTLTARIVSQTNTHANAQAGVMIRESLTTGAKHAMMLASPTSGLQFIHRNSTNGGYSVPVTVTGAAPSWLRLVRVGNTFTASTSTNGSSWTPVGSYTYTSPNTFSTGPVYVGLAVSSRVDGTLGTAVFDNVTVTPNP